MTNGTPHNSFHPLPAGLTEDDLVDLVEGALPAEREGVVIEALRREPRLGLLVKQMRADRGELAELATVRVQRPANMLEAIEAKLDREALSELVAESDQIAAPIPISRVQPGRRGVVSVMAESVWGRRLATAASIAIVGGLGYFVVRELARKWPALPQPAPIANNTMTTNPGRTGGNGPGAEERELAGNTPAPGQPDETPPGPATTVAAGPDVPNADPPAPHAMTPAEAVRLAEAGRLVIEVRSTGFEGTLRHLQELSRAAGRGMRWRAYEPGLLPAELASLAAPLPDESPSPDRPALPGRPASTPPTYAGDDASKPGDPVKTTDKGPTGLSLPPTRLVVRTVRVVQMPGDARALDDLLKDLNIAKDHQARLRVLPESAAIEVRPSLDPESVLWWSRGSDPGAWVRRVTVPVVVETAQ